MVSPRKASSAFNFLESINCVSSEFVANIRHSGPLYLSTERERKKAVLTLEQLRGQQDAWVETAKEKILRDGELRPIVFYFLPHADAAKRIFGSPGFQPVATLEVGEGEGAPESIVGVLQTCEPEWLVRGMISLGLPSKENAEALRMAMDWPGSLGQKERARAALSAMQTVNRRTNRIAFEKDILAAILREVGSRTQAYAAIKMDEGYTLVTEAGKGRDDYPEDLQTCQQSTECLISSMETRTFTRFVTVPILRKVPRDESSAVVGFGEAQVMDEVRPEGRFFGLLGDEGAH